MPRRGLLGSILAAPLAFLSSRIGQGKPGRDFPCVFGDEITGLFSSDQISFGTVGYSETLNAARYAMYEVEKARFDALADEAAGLLRVQFVRGLRPHAPQGGVIVEVIQDVGEL